MPSKQSHLNNLDKSVRALKFPEPTIPTCTPNLKPPMGTLLATQFLLLPLLCLLPQLQQEATILTECCNIQLILLHDSCNGISFSFSFESIKPYFKLLKMTSSNSATSPSPYRQPVICLCSSKMCTTEHIHTVVEFSTKMLRETATLNAEQAL